MTKKRCFAFACAFALCAGLTANGAETESTATCAAGGKSVAPQAKSIKLPTAAKPFRKVTTGAACDVPAHPPLLTAINPEVAPRDERLAPVNAPVAPQDAYLGGVMRKSMANTTLGGTGTPPANDECANATPITGPYPVTVCGTNVDATVDCPDTLNWQAVWYEIELPYEVNNLVADFCPSDFSLLSYQVGTVYLNSCDDCAAPVNGTYETHMCDNDILNAYVRWQDLQGPGTVVVPLYVNPNHEFCVEFNVTEITPPANDKCEDAELVTGPYPVTVCGTNQGATVDCPGVLDWNAVWYEVDLPYAINTVETDYCPTAIAMDQDTIGVVYYNDCNDCGAFVAGNYEWRDCGNFRRNPSVWWRDVQGPGTMLVPVYIDPSHEYCVDINVRDGDCTVPCPSNGLPEGEACGEATDDGCFLPTPAFKQITCGDTICGSGWAQNGSRDTDWFEIEITEPTTMTFTVEAEFLTGVQAGLIETLVPGVVGCDQTTGLINPYDSAVDCETLTVTYNAFPGTYWWFVSPDRFEGMPCGGRNAYTATMSCEPWEVRGACCDDETGTCTDNALYQECMDPMRFGQDMMCGELSPPCGGCPESMIEVEIRTDRYPSETTWEITDSASGNVICSGGPYQDDFETFFEYCCVEEDSCLEFTIYDQAGDGQSFGGGGYAVRLDDVELCSTLEGSWVGLQRTCENLGHACAAGRCCYSPWPNCDDVTFFDCVSLYDGLWSEGMSCVEDPCQDPAAPDFEMVAPFTTPQRTTCGALNRCHPENQYFETPEHVYKVTIPHDGVWSFNTCLDTSITTWLAVGTSMCAEDIGYAAWTCNGVGAEVVANLTAGDYYVDVEGYDQCGAYVLDVHEIPVCDVQCPANGVAESEACGDYANNGCWGWPQAFEPILAKRPVCGTVYADNGYDSDWFAFVAPNTDTMVFTVQANFAASIGVAEQYTPGVAGCDNFAGVINPSTQVADCNEASVTFPVNAGGTYYLYVGHQSSYGSPCGTTNDYVATVTFGSEVCGDLDGDGDVDYIDYVGFTNTFGRSVGHPDFIEECDYDGSGTVGLGDFTVWLTCYRDFIGDPDAGAPRPEEPRQFLESGTSSIKSTGEAVVEAEPVEQQRGPAGR